MHALRNIHAALAADAFLIDTQPVSVRPCVAAGNNDLGRLDMRSWLDTIHAVDERVRETITADLYDLQHEQRFVVTDRFDDGPDCLETVSNWQDTRVPTSLASRLEATQTTVTVKQEVRLRLLRRTG